MKKLLFLLMAFIFTRTYANNATYQKLKEVNKCWQDQKDVVIAQLPEFRQLDEHHWIELHLSLVEQKLRERSTLELSAGQQQNRLRCLEILHRYWQEGNFPLNEDYTVRTPIFIDKHNNFCAVGFLIKETGNEHISRMIASKMNLAYVQEMNFPELGVWANENGFTKDELAWIQPGYPPNSKCGKIGGGVDGFVQELYVDEASEQMYVGGKFLQADKSFVANNVAYVTENDGIYSWHKMGDGVNGQVNAITKFDSKIFVAGRFDMASGAAANNIAYWNGTAWHSAGCIDGVVNDLLVFKGNLYAAGSFTSCDSGTGKNFAIWKGFKWITIQGIEGKINTLEAVKDNIVLGGRFDFDSENINAIKWNQTSSFEKFDNKINNEVMDFELHKDTMYAVCKGQSNIDSNNLFLKLTANKWDKDMPYSLDFYTNYSDKKDTVSFNSICSESEIIHIGGKFSYQPGIGIGARNTYNENSGNWLWVDSSVNKIVLFKGNFIMGGKFKKGLVMESGRPKNIEVNGITVWLKDKTNIEKFTQKSMLNIYPNPAQSGQLLKLENNSGASNYTLSQIDGKLVAQGKLTNTKELQLPPVPAGIYLITLTNTEGEKAVSKLVIE